MDYGAHLSMIDFEGTEFSLEYLLRFTERADLIFSQFLGLA